MTRGTMSRHLLSSSYLVIFLLFFKVNLCVYFTLHKDRGLLGKGSYGQIYQGSDESGKSVAIKEIAFRTFSTRRIQMIKNEIEMMKRIPSHPALLQMIGYCWDDVIGVAWIVTESIYMNRARISHESLIERGDSLCGAIDGIKILYENEENMAEKSNEDDCSIAYFCGYNPFASSPKSRGVEEDTYLDRKTVGECHESLMHQRIHTKMSSNCSYMSSNFNFFDDQTYGASGPASSSRQGAESSKASPSTDIKVGLGFKSGLKSSSSSVNNSRFSRSLKKEKMAIPTMDSTPKYKLSSSTSADVVGRSFHSSTGTLRLLKDKTISSKTENCAPGASCSSKRFSPNSILEQDRLGRGSQANEDGMERRPQSESNFFSRFNCFLSKEKNRLVKDIDFDEQCVHRATKSLDVRTSAGILRPRPALIDSRLKLLKSSIPKVSSIFSTSRVGQLGRQTTESPDTQAKELLDSRRVNISIETSILVPPLYNSEKSNFDKSIRASDLFELQDLGFFSGPSPILEARIADLGRQVLEGLDILHNQLGIVHRDLKPENILVSNTRSYKDDSMQFGISYIICDFGLCCPVDSYEFPAGTAAFMPPEMGQFSKQFESLQKLKVTTAHDIWAYGRCLMWLFTDGPQPGEDLIVVLSSRLASKISPALHRFLSKCINSDPSKRATACDLLNDPFLKTRILRFGASTSSSSSTQSPPRHKYSSSQESGRYSKLNRSYAENNEVTSSSKPIESYKMARTFDERGVIASQASPKPYEDKSKSFKKSEPLLINSPLTSSIIISGRPATYIAPLVRVKSRVVNTPSLMMTNRLLHRVENLETQPKLVFPIHAQSYGGSNVPSSSMHRVS